VVDHGVLRDPEGRMGINICAIVADGKGKLYVVGRWSASEDDQKKGLAVVRSGTKLVVCFSVLDIALDSEKNQ
jgi:hypothetical protein